MKDGGSVSCLARIELKDPRAFPAIYARNAAPVLATSGLILDVGNQQTITAETALRREFKPGDVVPIAVDAEAILFLE